MNYRGSYRKLCGNAQASIIAAIEIYNKPVFDFRNECVSILIINAWELLLKAILSKNRESIFYRKRSGQAYRTLSWDDAFVKAQRFFPKAYASLAVRKNLDFLASYRDNSVHFYNAKDFGIVLYALTQTAVKNFRDLLDATFSVKLEEKINWHLMPIGIRPPVDLITYLTKETSAHRSHAVRQYLSELARVTEELKTTGEDSGRLLTVFSVRLESVKKIGDADAQIAVQREGDGSAPLAIVRTQDPNKTHPLRQMDVIKKVGALHGIRFTTHTFQAIAWKHGLKRSPQYCWQAAEGVLIRYSNDVVTFVKRLTKTEVDMALADYRDHLRSCSRRKAAPK